MHIDLLANLYERTVAVLMLRFEHNVTIAIAQRGRESLKVLVKCALVMKARLNRWKFPTFKKFVTCCCW